jgi:peptide/nickel transport system permease protein
MTTTEMTPFGTTESPWARRVDSFNNAWYKFSRNWLSILGLAMVLAILFLAIFAPYVTPYPQHAGKFVDFKSASQPPSRTHLMGTDIIGRDILTRVVLTGMVAGYYVGTRIETVIMRVTDVFISIPPLILALAMASMLKPTLMNSMMAVTVSWWPWYTRLMFSLTSSIRNEFYVQAAELTGFSRMHILFREILPNCASSVFTKMALDVGWVILVGAALSFVGLGEQPPAPALGTMVADGVERMPDQWWIAVFPALAIMVIVLGFNLFGDGIRDMLAPEEV